MKNKKFSSQNIFQNHEKQFVFIDDKQTDFLETSNASNDFIEQTIQENLVDSDEEVYELAKEEPDDFEEQAELVKSYKAPGLDDDFMGEYNPSVETLESNRYIAHHEYNAFNDLMFKAAEAGDKESLIFAFQEGANIEALNSEGETCLDVATKNNHQNCIDLINDFLSNKIKL